MLDRNQLPYLLKLLEDDSPSVRELVVRDLLSLGPDLEDVLADVEDGMTTRQRALLRGLLTNQRDAETRRQAWLRWPFLETPGEQLEAAFQLLAEFQYAWKPPVALAELLDELAEEFFTSGRSIDPVSLSRFLFIGKKFQGNIDDYNHPMNSNLLHVLQSRKGLPISLACVFILVGRRVGLTVTGCNVPGHFLARAQVAGTDALFDCFNGGRVLSARETAQLRSTLAPHHLHLLTEVAEPPAIIARVLHNLISAYEQIEETDNVRQCRDLLRDLLAVTES